MTLLQDCRLPSQTGSRISAFSRSHAAPRASALSRFPLFHSPAALLAVGVLLLTLASTTQARAAGISVTDLGVPAGTSNSIALGVNTAGEAVGGAYAFIPAFTPVYWDAANNLSVLPQLPGSSGGFAGGINSSGQIAGALVDTNGNYQGVIWNAAHSVSVIGGLSGDTNSVLTAINASGQAAGFSWGSSTPGYHPFIYDSTQGVTALSNPLPGSSGGIAFGINASGQVVGYCTILDAMNNGHAHAFVWDSTNGMQDLGFLTGGTDAYATGINSSGEVVGHCITAGDSHGFTWTAAQGIQATAELPGATDSYTYAINSSGQLSGYCIIAGQDHPTLWSDATHPVDLGGNASSSGGKGYGISDIAQVVGTLELTSGPSDAARWVTAPPQAPTSPTAVPGVRSVRLTWTAAPGTTSCNIYRATTSGAYSATPTFSGVAIVGGTAVTQSYTDTTATPGVTYYYVITDVNNSGESGRSPEVSATAAYPQHTVVFSNPATTEIGAWVFAGTSIVRTYSGGIVNDPQWKMVATPDLNGDGAPDVIFQSTTTGEIVYWLLDNHGNFLSAGDIGNTGDLQWNVVAAGDVNGDGNVDLVFQSSQTGAIVFWYLNSNHQLSGALGMSVNPGLSWHVFAVADVNHDGNADILFQNTSTTGVGFWLLDSTRQISGSGFIGTPGAGWQAVAALDIDGDGNLDVLYQNTTSSQVSYWLLDSSQQFASYGGIGAPGAPWTAAGAL